MERKSKLDSKLTIINLLKCLTQRKRKSITNSSDVVTKTRKVDTETDAEITQKRESKITALKDAIDDAHIELRQSIRDTIDSLSSDIEVKGKKMICYVSD